VKDVSPADFALVRALVMSEAGIVLEDGKEYLVESRLLPVARHRGMADVSALLEELRLDPSGPVRTLVVEAMTTNETSFFRDTRPFQALATEVLPEMMRQRVTERTLNVWSAACASGQEAYSTAMILDELLGNHPGWSARILATDVSGPMLERTRVGLYSQLEVNRGLPVAQLMQHFSRHGTQWLVAKRLRDMVETRQLNLVAPWPQLPQMDVVLLRNVMIYFDTATKQQILARVRSVLRPGGYLLLGGAETTLNLDDSYERFSVGGISVYRVRQVKAATA
jgi:chemotaxis protein methyltransferase CheR